MYEVFMSMLDWRNELSHVYSKNKFESLREKILSTKDIWKDILKLFNQEN